MILNDVVATVSTKNRTHTTLPLVLTSLLCSNYKPHKLIVYDDNDTLKDPREDEIYKNLLQGLINVGIQWFWLPGKRSGQIHNHEQARLTCEEEFIWRIDDDNILPSNVLEVLYNTIKSQPTVGAVGPSILDPKTPGVESKLASNSIEDIFLGINVQWNHKNSIQVVKVDHLQGSTFLYRRKAATHGYNLNLSRVGHREETLFTYEMVINGWTLLAVCGLKTWHMRFGAGGIRSHNEEKLFRHDDAIFQQKLNEWGVKTNGYKFIYLNSGRGDHFAFKIIMEELVERNKDKKIFIGACYQDVFWDISYPNVVIMSLADVQPFVNPDDHNLYKFMAENNWKTTMTEAYRKLYL